MQNKLNLFVEAPTGMGKTLATLYPAIKALPLISDGKVFYVTAKTPGRLAAQAALQKLRDTGVQVRSVSREMYSASLAVDDLSVATGTREGKTAGKVRVALGAARDRLEALMKSASTGVIHPKPYHRGAFAAEAVAEGFIETLRALAEAIEAFLVEQSSRETALPWLEPYFAVHRFLQLNLPMDKSRGF